MDNQPIFFQRLARQLDGSFCHSTSWFGGLPRLGGQQWPMTYGSGTPQPIPFLAQIDLAALADQDTTLPKSGSLAFFEEGDWGDVLLVVDHMAHPVTPYPAATAPETSGQTGFMTPNGHDPMRPNWGRHAYWPCARVDTRPLTHDIDNICQPEDQPFSFHTARAMGRSLQEASEKVGAKKSKIHASIRDSKAWLAQDLNRSNGGWLKRLVTRTCPDQRDLIAIVNKEVAAERSKLHAINQHHRAIADLSAGFAALVGNRGEHEPLTEDELRLIKEALAPLSTDFIDAADAMGIWPLSFWTRFSTRQATLAIPSQYTTLPLSVRQRLLGDDTGFCPYGSALQMFGHLDPTSAVTRRGDNDSDIFLAQVLAASKPSKDVYETVFLIQPEDLAAQNWDNIWCENGIY